MKRKIVAIITVLLLLTLNTLPAFAATLAITSTEQSCTHPLGSSIVMGSGYFKVNQAAECTASISLQKNVNGSWVTIANKNATNYSSTYATTSGTWTVDSGYSYRIKAVYKAVLGADTVTKTVYTSTVSF